MAHTICARHWPTRFGRRPRKTVRQLLRPVHRTTGAPVLLRIRQVVGLVPTQRRGRALAGAVGGGRRRRRRRRRRIARRRKRRMAPGAMDGWARQRAQESARALLELRKGDLKRKALVHAACGGVLLAFYSVIDRATTGGRQPRRRARGGKRAAPRHDCPGRPRPGRGGAPDTRHRCSDTGARRPEDALSVPRRDPPVCDGPC